jgi:hypothetical protein
MKVIPMHFKPLFTYALISVMFINLSGPALLVAATGASLLLSSTSYAQTVSDTPLLDELTIKHDLANSDRNHQEDVIPSKIQNQIDNPPPSRNMAPQIEKVLSSPVITRNLDLINKYPNTSSFSDYKDSAVNISKPHGQPAGVISGTSLESLDV